MQITHEAFESYKGMLAEMRDKFGNDVRRLDPTRQGDVAEEGLGLIVRDPSPDDLKDRRSYAAHAFVDTTLSSAGQLLEAQHHYNYVQLEYALKGLRVAIWGTEYYIFNDSVIAEISSGRFGTDFSIEFHTNEDGKVDIVNIWSGSYYSCMEYRKKRIPHDLYPFIVKKMPNEIEVSELVRLALALDYDLDPESPTYQELRDLQEKYAIESAYDDSRDRSLRIDGVPGKETLFASLHPHYLRGRYMPSGFLIIPIGYPWPFYASLVSCKLGNSEIYHCRSDRDNEYFEPGIYENSEVRFVLIGGRKRYQLIDHHFDFQIEDGYRSRKLNKKDVIALAVQTALEKGDYNKTILPTMMGVDGK